MLKNELVKRISLMFVSALILFMSISGCGTGGKTDQKSESAVQTTSEKAATVQESTTVAESLPLVKLTWYMIGSGNQADEQEVFAAANRYAKEKINADVTFIVFDWGEYDQKMKIKIAASEPFDICFTSDWANNYFQNVSKGVFLDVSELLPKYAPKKYAAIPSWVWEGLKVNGKLYGIINGFIAWQDMFWYRKDLVEKYKFDYESVNRLEDNEPFLKAVKDGDPSMYPFTLCYVDASQQNFLYSQANIDQIVGTTLPGVIRRDDPSLKLLNQYDPSQVPEYVDMLRTLHKWYLKHYINPDAATIKNANTYIKAHKVGMGVLGAYYPGTEQEIQASIDNLEVVAHPIGKPHITPDSILKTINAISVNSKNPERAVMLLELSNTDRAFFRILGAGIEGKHYKDLGNNTIELLPDSKYMPWNNWAWGDLDRNGYLTKGQPANMLDYKANSGTNGEPSYALGFPINNEPVKTQLAQIQTVIDTYFPLLITGTSDPDKVLPEFNAKLKNAGLDKFFEEIQRQLYEWKASKSK